MVDALRTRLTRADELLLWRRRGGCGQLEASLIVGVGRTTYSRMENGQKPVKTRRGAVMVPWKPLHGDYRPTGSEKLYLTRKRSGLALAEIAERLGTTKPTVLRWEREADYRLRDFWRSGGGWEG